MSHHLNDSTGAVKQYSAAVTTGQGQCDWKDTVSLGRTFGSRSPIPTCGIPPPSFANTKIFTSAPDPVTHKMATRGCMPEFATTRGSDSAESMQHSLHQQEPEGSELGSLSLSESDSGEEDVKTPRGARNAGNPQDKRKEKKKVGRPIAYRGDPNSPDLTEPERRRIKRRIANRESARRVRHKRQSMLEELQVKIERLNSQNSDLRTSVAEANYQKEDLGRQLREITEKYKLLMAKNENMHCELQSLRSSMQVRMNVLEDALERQDAGQVPPQLLEEPSAFGSMNAQSSQTPGFVTQPVFPCPAAANPSTEFKGSFSFQLDFDYMSALEDQKSLDLLNCTNQELALFKSSSTLYPNNL